MVFTFELVLCISMVVIAQSTLFSTLTRFVFHAQFNPAIGVAAVVAAIPPVLFWARVYNNAQKAIKEKEQEEEDRKVRDEKLAGLSVGRTG